MRFCSQNFNWIPSFQQATKGEITGDNAGGEENEEDVSAGMLSPLTFSFILTITWFFSYDEMATLIS